MKAICLQCGKYNGPNLSINSDCAGWICPKCYERLQEKESERELEREIANMEPEATA